jgi:F-type H+-transporting ATPase subunit delta
MSQSRLADRYAKALFAAADSAGAVDAVAADVERLGREVANASVCGLLTRPDVPRATVHSVLEKLGAEDGRHPLVRNVLGVLAERRRAAITVELPAAFARLSRIARGELEGVVASSVELDEAGRNTARDLAHRLSGGKTVHLSFETDPELLGGIRLQIGNTLYDGSLRTQLEDLHERLLAAPLS